MGLFSTLGSIGGGIGGAFIGGPGGAIAGAGAGGALGGMADGSDEYTAPSFADIDLASANPELWKQLQQISAQADEAEKLYHARQQGMTYAEKTGLQSGLSNIAHTQAQRGQLGSAVGNAQQADAEARIRSSIAQRAFQEQQALQQNAMQQRQQYAQQFLGAQQAVLNPMQQAAQMNFQSNQANNQAQNQFYSGLFNAGAGLYGQNQNIDAMSAYRQNNPSPYSYGVTGNSPYPSPYTSQTYSPSFFGSK